jgi:hypothetical protein
MTKMLSNCEENLNSLKRNAEEMSDDDSADPTQEEDSCSDAGTSGTNSNKRAKTQEEKRLDRILANRRSARRSRERRKQLQDNLEKSVFLLTKQNEDLSHENDGLKQDVRNLMSLLNEKRSLGSSPAPPPPHPAACGLSDSSLYQELLLRMAESGSSSAGGNNVIAATADRNNSYSTALAASLQKRQLLADLSFLGGASTGHGQQFYSAKGPGLIGGRWDLR